MLLQALLLRLLLPSVVPQPNSQELERLQRWGSVLACFFAFLAGWLAGLLACLLACLLAGLLACLQACLLCECVPTSVACLCIEGGLHVTPALTECRQPNERTNKSGRAPARPWETRVNQSQQHGQSGKDICLCTFACRLQARLADVLFTSLMHGHGQTPVRPSFSLSLSLSVSVVSPIRQHLHIFTRA